MIDFLKYQKVFFLISLFFIVTGIYSITRFGYRFSIEFTGGTNINLQLPKNTNVEEIRRLLAVYEIRDINIKDQILNLKTAPLTKDQEKEMISLLEKKLNGKVNLLGLETIGPTVGQAMVRKTLIAVVFSVLIILFYISFAFKGIYFALSAIVALIHDVLILLGSYSMLSYFSQAQFDTLFVTALLTTMSFSVHDTIVIFDKIREYLKENYSEDLTYLANQALTQTMIRSINNSMTIIFMLLSLSALGGETIRFFALALLIGTITGTYSSPFVALPVYVFLTKRFKR